MGKIGIVEYLPTSECFVGRHNIARLLKEEQSMGSIRKFASLSSNTGIEGTQHILLHYSEDSQSDIYICWWKCQRLDFQGMKGIFWFRSHNGYLLGMPNISHP